MRCIDEGKIRKAYADVPLPEVQRSSFCRRQRQIFHAKSACQVSAIPVSALRSKDHEGKTVGSPDETFLQRTRPQKEKALRRLRTEGVIPMENTSPIKAIREFCLGCVGHSAHEVKLCPSVKCPLYPFRFGKNPFLPKREFTDEQKAAAAERLARARERKKNG